MTARKRTMTISITSAFALCVLAAVASGADMPTREEWTPVFDACEADKPEAQQLLQDLVNRFPKWSVGFRYLARWDWRHRQDQDCVTAAERALALDANDDLAAALAVQALGRLGRGQDGMQIAAHFPAGKDSKGLVHFAAASDAFALSQLDAAESELHQAKEAAGRAVPADFHFLDGRIAARKGDLQRADASFTNATVLDGRMWDAWFELGRVETAIAEQVPERADASLIKAADAFERVTKALPDDYESWLGLGRCQLAQGKRELESTGGESGSRLLRAACASASEALKRKDDLAAAHACLGEAQLRLENWDEAVTHLRRARDLGLVDTGLEFNLAMALGRSGHADQAKDLMAGNNAISADEKITKGIICYRAKSYAIAAQLLESALTDPAIAQDRERSSAVARYIGHAWRDDAARWRDLAAHALDAEGKSNALTENEHALDRAADAYRRAAEGGDRYGQDHFLALQDGRDDPALAYRAGWSYLAWRSYLSLSGWEVVARNYGSSGAWRSPVHIGVWCAILALFAIGWLRSMFRGRAPAVVYERVDVDERESLPRNPTTKRPAPAPVPRALTRTPAPRAPTRAPTKAPATRMPTRSPTRAPTNVKHTKTGAPANTNTALPTDSDGLLPAVAATSKHALEPRSDRQAKPEKPLSDNERRRKEVEETQSQEPVAKKPPRH